MKIFAEYGEAYRIEMLAPDNWHNHFRQKDDPRFRPTVAYIASQFARANAMGNTVPPITTAEQIVQYRRDIEEAATEAGFPNFEPLMVLMMTPDTTPEMVTSAFNAGAYGLKIMPANVTTHSSHGIVDYKAKLFRDCLRVARSQRKPALFHAEVVDPSISVQDREQLFIPILSDIREEFPNLPICVEHISDADMVQFVMNADSYVSATVTPHHMEVVEADAQHDVHLQCMPYPKQMKDVEAVRFAAFTHPRFFYGSDNAPHLRPTKEREHPSPASGVFTAPVELSVLVELFERYRQLEKLEAFLSERGARWHGVRQNKGEVTLHREPWVVPDVIDLGDGNEIVPYKHGHTLNWRLADCLRLGQPT